MILLNLLTFFYVFCGSSSFTSSQSISRLLVKNGNIEFVPGTGKSIKFQTIGSAGVSINGFDLLTTLEKARNATRLLENYQTNFASYADRLNSIEYRITDRTGRNISEPPVRSVSVSTLRRSFRALLTKVNAIKRTLQEDNCHGNPCKNGATCQDMYKTYLCYCADGWQGQDCTEDVNECAMFEGTELGCQNGAICENLPGSYKCNCQAGFVGTHCHSRTADCSRNGQELCGNGDCIPQNNVFGYRCICKQGWTTDGVHPACTEDYDECHSGPPPCSTDPFVECTNVPGSFVCGRCPNGYTEKNNRCIDINECEIYNGGCSVNPMVTCTNTKGSRKCGYCPSGYEGDGITCSYKGVCNINNGNCHYMAQCINNPRISPTDVVCICPAGYTGQGIGPSGCVLLGLSHPCVPNPCINGQCSINNATGGYVCTCKPKFTGRNCEIADDPCALNPCMNGGTCRNLNGVNFQCSCLSGFSGTLCETESQGCDKQLSGLSGVLTYPPDNFASYVGGVSCSWVIETNDTQVLDITFNKFEVENSTGCQSGWLQIHDGPHSASPALGRFCGTEPPQQGHIVTTQNTIYLWLKSTVNIKMKFNLTWNSKEPECGGFHQDSAGSIQSPGSPGNYPPNRDCHWMFINGGRYRFQFVSLNIGNNPDCNGDYIEFKSAFRGMYSGVFAKICNSSIPSPFYSPGGIVNVHFHSDKENSYPGFQLSYSHEDRIPGCGGDYTDEEGTITSLEDPRYLICTYKISHNQNFRTKITFLRFDIQNCENHYVEIREGSNVDSPLIGRYCGTTVPDSYTSNQILTIISSTFHDSGGWKLKYEKVCVKKFVNETGSFESIRWSCIYQIEQAPGYIIELNIKLSADYDSPCIDAPEYVEIRDGDDENANLLKRLCGTVSEIITSTYNHLWIQHHRTASLTFEATYTSTNLGCGGILKNKTGNFGSPVHPEGNYPPNSECIWVIIAPPQNVIQLTFLNFNLEGNADCAYDSLQVYDNNTALGSGNLIGKYCGNKIPPLLLSSSNIMTVVFVSDITIHMEGFLATYTVQHKSNVCGGDYYTSSGIIETPSYPNNYPINRNCSWAITVGTGQQIELNITDFSLENIHCGYDWLEIRNGGTLSSPLIGKYCGTSIPKRITSHTNELFLYFHSDSSRTERGFKITWSTTATGCGGALTSPTGSITSPHYPEPYERNTDCTWIITVAAGSRIQVVFSDIDLEPNIQCQENYTPDYVELLDGNSINSKSLGKLCNVPLNPLVSSSYQMLVKFRSDISYQGKGFQLHYSTICNNTLTGFRGLIQSPNFPNRYAENLNCWWDIMVPTGNDINITFSAFELESTYIDSCDSVDYIEVKYLERQEDYYEDSNFIEQGKYCGVNNPGHLSIKSDHVQIHFVSDYSIAGEGFELEWQLFGCGGLLKHSDGIIKSPNYPNPYPTSIECLWHIEVEFTYRIEIEFQIIDVEKDRCLYDWIKIYNGPNNSSNELATMCHQVKPIVLSSTSNQMFIEFHADYSYQGKGFIANYSSLSTKCGGRFTAAEGHIYSPNYPKNYDRSDTCYWLIDIDEGHSIELHFEDVDLPGDCNNTYIKAYDGPTEAYPVLITVCENAPNQTIRSTFNEMYLEFSTGITQYTTKGFHAKYIKACGSRITTNGSGDIRVTSHEFINDYTCTWTIVSTDPSLHITLTITQIYLHSYDCDNDHYPIKIYGGETTESPLLKSYCDTKLPPPIVSDGSAITIVLLESMDFFATYSVLDSHCGGKFNALTGYFASPGYPNQYPYGAECEWTINVAPGNHLTLTFIEFNILDSDKCNTDFLEIRSNNVSGPLLGYYCGNKKPTNITHEGTLWMLLKSSTLEGGEDFDGKGFYGEYELNRYNDLNGPQGVIASPMYPQKFYSYEGSYKITVASKKRILLSFKEFYMEADEDFDCYFAVFAVYDGVDDTAPLLKSLCGGTLPDPIESSTNIIFIKIMYSYFKMGSFFLLEWLEISKEPTNPNPEKELSDCGSTEPIDMTIRNNYTITSPGYPHGYKPNLNCQWIFSTISMNHLVLQFEDINLKNYPLYTRFPSCYADYVSLYTKQSNDNDWELIQNVCGTGNSNSNFDSTNLLKVKFETNAFQNGTGFKATVIERCGGSMTESTGVIYFNKTTFYHSCEWNITVRSGKTIKVIFEEMDIARNLAGGCDNYLMLRNGKYRDSPLLGIGKYCGTDVPDPLNTTGNYLYVNYTGSPFIKAFRLKYQEISVECSGELTLSSLDNSTEINSPNYPNIPSPHTECTWVIRAPADKLLRIDFEDQFDLTYQAQCGIEYVELRDGGTEYSPLLGRYCRHAPNTQFSSGNIMFVKFFTNTEDPRHGFKAKISLDPCGGVIRDIRGKIKNPTTQNINGKFNCTWHIVGPIDHYLDIQFTKLELEQPENKITIYERIDMAVNFTVIQNNLTVVRGSTIPEPITTSGNAAIINYVGTTNDKFELVFNISQSECGDILNIESGTITSPGYPMMNYLHRYCEWTITVPDGRRITINFDDLDLGDAMSTSAVIFLLEGFKSLATITTETSNRTYETDSNEMKIYFFARDPSSHRGFKATYSSSKPTICTSDFTRESGVLTHPSVKNYSYRCHWKHNSRNPFHNETLSLTINFNTNTTEIGNTLSNCMYSKWAIIVKNKDAFLSNLCIPNTKTHVVRSAFPTTEVIAFTSYQMNLTIAYNTFKCGGILNEQDGFIASPNYPNKPNDLFECAWLIKVGKEQTINLTMLNINLGNDCDKSFVAVYNGDGPLYPRIGEYCDTKPDVIISQSDSLWIEYKYEINSTGTGFKLKYEAISTGCGGTFHDVNRIIQTPNYGNNYPNNAECLWEIRSNPGYSIELQFVERFQIEDSDNCVNDYIEIWDWQNDQWISMGKKCGREIPKGIRAKENRLKLLFRSNDKTTASGFKAKWIWMCGGTFEAMRYLQTIVSPGYPNLYRPNLNCVYNITTKGEVVTVVFEDFDLEEDSSDCMYDNVTVSGPNFIHYGLAQHTYCGARKPTPLRAKTVIVTFKTNSVVNHRGFKFIYYDESCGGVVNKTGIIEGTPVSNQIDAYGYYQPRITCIWNITAPPKQIAILTVLHMSLPACYAQVVNVYNGLNTDKENRLISFCGNITNFQPIHADSGSMLVKLDSSPHQYGGFKAVVYFSHGPTEGCGGLINLTETKTISAPELEDLDCSWTIIAPRDHQIQIQFTALNIPGSCSNSTAALYCTCSFIEIRDGGGPLSELIEKLCSTSNHSPDYRKFTTSWFRAYIRFVLQGRQNNAFRVTLTPVESICGPSILNATKEGNILTTPNYPNKYPASISCYWVIYSETLMDIELHFIDFNLTGTKSHMDNRCDGDKLVLSEDPNTALITEGLGPDRNYKPGQRRIYLEYNNNPGDHIFCGSESSPFDYYAIGKSITLSFKSILTQEQGTGFKIEYRKVGCNRNYTGVQGRLFNSGAISDCIITITVPENRTISLYFQTFMVSYSDQNCIDSAFEVRENGPNGTLLMRACGYSIPNPVFSFTNKLYINYTGKGNMYRYDAVYTSTDAGRGCGGQLYNYRGRVSSPLYPNEFRNSTTCTWEITVPIGLRATLKFGAFDIQGSCSQTYVTVTTYQSSNTVIKQTFCKNDNPGILRSNSRIDISYTSSVHNGGTGWMATFQGISDDTEVI